jgi:S-adenosylmethionine-dependent methyltransferase
MRQVIRDRVEKIFSRLFYPLPRHLKNNQIEVNEVGLNAIRNSLKENYYTGQRNESTCTKEMFEKDFNEHLYRRLENDRIRVVPWLDNARPLKKSSILEIGCGTGSSTVALSEQGAKVTALDIDEGALCVAQDRCKVCGLRVQFKMLNAAEICNVFSNSQFDFIIFFACIEHMTISERLASLRSAWDLLAVGGLLVIIETPNRLWYFDAHTSLLPFFHWLPDELAFKYSRFSPRENFCQLYRECKETLQESFFRWGRGVSFHEIDVAIKPVSELRVVSSLSTFLGLPYKLRLSKLERRYKSVLRGIYPNIHEGFFDRGLDLIIKKD